MGLEEILCGVRCVYRIDMKMIVVGTAFRLSRRAAPENCFGNGPLLTPRFRLFPCKPGVSESPMPPGRRKRLRAVAAGVCNSNQPVPQSMQETREGSEELGFGVGCPGRSGSR